MDTEQVAGPVESPAPNRKLPMIGIIALVVGALIVLILVLFPNVRNAIWNTLFGTPEERLLGELDKINTPEERRYAEGEAVLEIESTNTGNTRNAQDLLELLPQ